MEKVSIWMMFCCTSWLFLAAVPITGDDAVIPGFIFPQVKFVLRGSDVTLYCKLNITGWVENVHWGFSPRMASRVVSGIVNDTVSMVTIPKLSAGAVKVACKILAYNLQLLDEISVMSGYPPEAPENMSCIYFHKHNVTCSWIPGNDPEIPTTFYLTVLNDAEKTCTAAGTNSCSFNVSRGEEYGREYNVRLQVLNGLGEATRHFTVNTAEIVKIYPPEILSLKPCIAKDPSFFISWRRPSLAPNQLEIKCILRYRQLQEDQWLHTPDLYMDKEKEMSYILSGLHAYTEYAVSLRCIGSSGQMWWSEWSAKQTGRTTEQALTHSVELWRVIDSTERTRLVYLRWRERSGIRSTGITQGYNVRWFPEDRTFDSMNENTTNNEMMIHVSQEAHVISVVHYNSAGRSPEATLRIPATGEKAREVISSLQVSAAEGEDVTVTWTVTDSRYLRFVLDWCIDSGVGLCNISFQYVENSSTWTIERGTLEPYKRYRISVHPLLEDRTEAPATTYLYSKERAPLSGPNTKVGNVKKMEATIRWDRLGADEESGFITTYGIVYKPLHGEESVVKVNGNVYEYSLRSLTPDTFYSAYIVASNSAGSARGNHIQFRTLADSKSGNEYIGALAGILAMCLLLLLVLGITYQYKKEKIKNLLWPSVPDPSHSSISDWSSDWLQAVQLLDPAWTDGTLHSGDLHILHAVYVNDRRVRELLLPDSWERAEDTESTDKSSIAMHYAMMEKCPESAAGLLLFDSTSRPPGESDSYSNTAAVEEMPPDLYLSEDTAAINPYLKNSVRTRETLHVTEHKEVEHNSPQQYKV